MRGLRVLVVPVLATVLGSCTTASPESADRPKEWAALLRQRDVSPADVRDPMAPSEAMRRAAVVLHPIGSPRERLEALQAYFFGGPETRPELVRAERGPFHFVYEGHGTYLAADAFERMAGNCVAFTNLFISMGRLIGIPLFPALAQRERRSEKEGDLIIVTSHLVAVYPEGARYRIFDFNAERLGPLGSLKFLDDGELAAVAMSNRAVALVQEGNAAAALHDLEIAARLAPRDAALLGNLGVARWRLGDIEGARQTFQKALSISPREPTVLHNVAALYASEGRRAEALAALALADAAKATPYTFLVRGDLELAAGALDKAMKSYRQARRLGPSLAEPLIGMARIESVRGRKEAAKRLLNQALKLSPDNATAQHLLSAL